MNGSSIKLVQKYFSTASTSINKKIKVDLFYDVISPYSWFAFEVLQRYTNKWQIHLQLRPSLLGAIFKVTDNISVPRAKVQHSHEDVTRCARYYDVPLQPLENIREVIAKGSMFPQRCLTAVGMTSPEHLADLSRGFFTLRLSKDQDFTTKEGLVEALQIAGLSTVINADELSERANDKDVRLKLRDTTDSAIHYGAFGVPTIIMHSTEGHKMFFGADRLPMLAFELNEKWLGPNPL